PPKTPAGARSVALDKRTVAVLRRHARRQHTEQVAAAAAGRRSHESGYVFTRTDGTPLHPDYISQRFRLLVDRTGLPPIRLHDPQRSAGRHGYVNAPSENSGSRETMPYRRRRRPTRTRTRPSGSRAASNARSSALTTNPARSVQWMTCLPTTLGSDLSACGVC